MLDKFVLVPYEIQGKDGKILIKDDINATQIKMGCIQDYIEQNVDDFDVLIKLD